MQQEQGAEGAGRLEDTFVQIRPSFRCAPSSKGVVYIVPLKKTGEMRVASPTPAFPTRYS